MVDSSGDTRTARSSKQSMKLNWKHIVISPRFLAAVIIVQLLVLSVLVYAISVGCEISFDKASGLLIRPRVESDKIRTLEQQLASLQTSTVKKADYDDLLSQLRDLQKTTINIGMLPDSLQLDKPDQVIEEIKRLLQQARESIGDVALSLAVIGKELELCGIIDSNQQESKRTQNTNFHIQRVLHAIGFYEGPLEGKRDPTYRAVLSFQRSRSLTADGKLGKKTWAAVREQWDETEKQR